MLKRIVLASIMAVPALAAWSAVADTQWYYEGHGWLSQPPISSSAPTPERGMQVAGAIPAPSESKESGNAPARFCEPSGKPFPERPLEQCGY